MRMNCGAECDNRRKQQRLQREHNSIIEPMSSVLSCAFLEWVLMFLLFINALFSFLVTQFARLCKLQTPCLLCSSLDHILLQSHADKIHFYNDLICHSHKKEISTLTYCPIHSKLAAANVMTSNEYLCKECCSGLIHSVEKKNDSIFHSSSSVTTLKHCSCCSVPFECESPCFEAPRIDKCMDDGYKSMMVKKTMENSNSDQSENADQLKDNIDVNHVPPEVATDQYSYDRIVEKHEEERLDKCIKPDTVPLLAPADIIADSTPLASKGNLESMDEKITGSENLITRTSTSNSDAIPIQTTRDVGTGSNIDLNDAYKLATINKRSSIPSPTVTNVITGRDSSKLYEDLKTRTSTSDPNAITSQTTRDMGPSSNMDMNDAYKLATGNTSSALPSPTVAEVITGRDSSSKVYADLRLLVSHFSAARGLESPWAELSPSPRVLHDPSNNAILQHITKSLSIDRNESGLELLDRSSSIVSEIEGETLADRLKRQIDLDRKSMYLLYKELEEERNASAVAAYQAMAMITRLQEEKASMHMEALQYQRMMEEQSEYDQEAILKSNQVVFEKEKEVQDLEAQLAFFRKQVGDDFVFDEFEKMEATNFVD